VEGVSSTTATLQDVASVDEFLNAVATETVPLFVYLEFEFQLEHEFTSHLISLVPSSIATTRTSTELSSARS